MKLPQRWWVRALIGVGVVVLLLGGLVLAYSLRLGPGLRSTVDTFLREKAVTLVAGIAPDRIKVDLGEFDLDPLRGLLVIHGVKVTYADTTAVRRVLLDGSAPLVFLTGINATDMVFRRRLVLSGIRIIQPTLIRQETATGPDTAAAASIHELPPLAPDSAVYSLNTADSTLYATVAEWLPAELHSSHIDRIRVEHGTLVTASGPPERQATDTVSGFDLDLKGLGLDGENQRVFHEALIAATRYRRDRPESPHEVLVYGLALKASPVDTAITLDSAAFRSGPDSRFRVVGLHRSFSKQTMRVKLATLEAEPDEPGSPRLAPPRAPGLLFTLHDFAIDGMRFGPTFRRSTVAQSVRVADASFDLAAPPPGPKPAKSRSAVAPVARSLPWGAVIDSFTVARLRFHYAGADPAGRGPSTVELASGKPVLLTGVRFGRLAEPMAGADSVNAHPAPFDSLLYSHVARVLPLSLHSARIAGVTMADARLILTHPGTVGTQRDSIGAITLHLTGVGYDSLGGRMLQSGSVTVPRIALAARSASPTVLHGLRIEAGGRKALVSLDSTAIAAGKNYRLRVTHLRHELDGGVLTVGELRYAPLLEDAAFFRSMGMRTTRVQLAVRDLAVRGLDFGAAFRQAIVARRVELGDLSVDAMVDQQYPSQSDTTALGAPLPRGLMPTQALARLGWAVAVDTVVLRAGAVRYTESAPTASAPATIVFDKLSATGTGLVNRRTGRPFDLHALAAINGEGRIAVHFVLPVRRDAFAMDVDGTWSGMPLAGLNSFLVATGYKLTEGAADATTFTFRIANDSALGELHPTWHGLKVELVNKQTGKPNLGSKIKSFLAKSFVIRANNQPGQKNFRASVPIAYALTPGDTFFGALWRSMRSALVVAMKK